METYRTVVFHDLHVSIGIACRLMMDRPAFAKLPFGSWMRMTAGQAERGHIRFFLDTAERVRGFFGYALCSHADAEAWAFRNVPLDSLACRDGECMLINAWVGDDGTRNAMVDEARRISAVKLAVYYKRFYPDGRIRPVRLPRTPFHNSLATSAESK